MKKLKLLDLFSGLGGFSLGLERTGHFKTVAFCDNDKYSRLILDKHWKGTKVYEDIRQITKEQFDADGIEYPDIITGGFPCQPFSIAGKQKGTSDDRHLWPEMFRIIKTFQPRFVIGENVRGIVNIQDGLVFETVCTDLESEGYEVQPFNIPAAGVGAPHRRERIFFLAIREDVANTIGNDEGEEISRGNGEEDFVQEEHRKNDHSSRFSSGASAIRSSDHGHETDVANAESISSDVRGHEQHQGERNGQGKIRRTSSSDVADTDTRFGNGENQKIQSGGKTSDTSSAGKGTDVADTDTERLQGAEQPETYTRKTETQFSTTQSSEAAGDFWIVEPNVGRVAHGISGRVYRLKGLGNSIVPQIAEEIGKAIIKSL